MTPKILSICKPVAAYNFYLFPNIFLSFFYQKNSAISFQPHSPKNSQYCCCPHSKLPKLNLFCLKEFALVFKFCFDEHIFL